MCIEQVENIKGRRYSCPTQEIKNLNNFPFSHEYVRFSRLLDTKGETKNERGRPYNPRYWMSNEKIPKPISISIYFDIILIKIC